MKKLLSLLLVTSILLTAVYATCPGIENSTTDFTLSGNVVPTPYTLSIKYGQNLLTSDAIHVDLESSGNSEKFTVNLSYGNCCQPFDVAVDLTVGDFINECCIGSNIRTKVYNKSVSPSEVFDLATADVPEFTETVSCGPNAEHAIGSFLIQWLPGSDPAAGSYTCEGCIDITVS